MSSGHIKDFNMMCDTLQCLLRKSKNLWKARINLSYSKLGIRTVENYNKLIGLRRPISPEELEKEVEKKRKSKKRNLQLDKPFYLPPLEKDPEFIPLLFLKCDLDKSSYDISLRIEMYRYRRDNSPRLEGFGLRFEMHEKPSEHDYAHVQVTNEHDGAILPECPGWLPTTLPCIPAKAECPVSLIFCMLISFYGKKMYNKIFPADLNIEDRCKKILKDIL